MCQIAILNFMDKLQRTRLKMKTKPIARRRRNYVYPLLSILIFIGLSYIFFNFSPIKPIELKGFEIPTKPIFLIAIFGLLYTAVTFISNKKSQGLLVATLTTGYLLLRFIGLTHWLFLILFIALFITLELFILKKK